MPRIRDLPEVAAKYGPGGQFPTTSFTPGGTQLLDLELPPTMGPAGQRAVGKLMAERLSRFTTGGAAVRSSRVSALADSAEAAAAPVEPPTPGPVGRIALQFGAGTQEGLPTPVRVDVKAVPEPRGMVEQVARGAGAAVSLGTQAAVLEPLVALLPFLGGAAGASAAVRGGLALGAPVAAATEGGLKQRGIAGLTTAATAGATRVVGPAVARAAFGAQRPAVVAAGQRATGAIGDYERRVALYMSRNPQGTKEEAARFASVAGRRATQAAEEAVHTSTAAAHRSQIAGQAAGLATATVGFGALEPAARTLLLRATGEDVEMPTLDDFAQSIGSMAILNLAGAPGLLRRAPTRARFEPRAAGEAPGAPAELGTRPSAPPPAVSQRQIAIFEQRGRGLSERPMAVAGGRSARDLYRERFDAYLARRPSGTATPADDDVYQASGAAVKVVKGFQAAEEAITEPPMPTALAQRPEAANAARQGASKLTQRLNQLIVGRMFHVELPGVSAPMRVLHTAVFPWADQQVRILALDPTTNRVVPVQFATVEDMRGRIKLLEEPGPSGGLFPRPDPQQQAIELTGKAQPLVAPPGMEAAGGSEVGTSGVPAGETRSQAEPRGATPAIQGLGTQKRAGVPGAAAQLPDRGGIGKEDVAHPPMETVALAEILGGAENRAEWARMQKEGAEPEEIHAAVRTAFGAGGGSTSGKVKFEYQGGDRPALKVGGKTLGADEIAQIIRRDLLIPTRRERLEALGQEDIFGGAPMLGPEGRVGELERAEPQEPVAEVRTDLASAAAKEDRPPTISRTARAQSIHRRPEFQQRQTTTAELVDPAHIQDLLEQRGGYSLDQMTQRPVVVWTDPADGKLYVIDGHHRLELAQHGWAKSPETGRWVQTGLSDRDVPVVEVFGTIEQAKADALLANKAGKGNTITETAAIAHARLTAGASLRQVKAELKARSEGEVQKHADFYQVDPEVRARFFPPGAEDSRLGSIGYASKLGDVVRRHPKLVTREVQMQLVEQAVREALNQKDFADAVSRWVDMLSALPQEAVASLAQGTGPKPVSFSATVGRIDRQVRRTTENVATAARSLSKAAEQGVPGMAKGELEAVVRALRQEAMRLKKLQGEVVERAQALLKTAAAGEDWSKGMTALEQYVDQQLGVQGPPDWGASQLSFMGTGPLARFVGRMFFKGTERAVAAYARRLGNRGMTLRHVDPNGNVVARVPIRFEPDPTRQSLTYKLAALARLGGSIAMPPDLLRSGYEARAQRAYGESMPHERFVEIVGTKGMVWLGHNYSANGRTWFRVMDGVDPPSALPPFMRDAVEKVRALQERMLVEAQEIAKAHGVKVPGRIEGGYASHLRGGLAADLLDPFITELFPEYQGRPDKMEEIRNQFFEHRGDDPNYEQYWTPSWNAYVSQWARFVSGVPFIAKTREALLQLQETEPWRAEAVRSIVRAWMFPKKGGLETAMDEAIRWTWFERSTGGISQVGQEQVKAWLGWDQQRLDAATIPTREGPQPATRFVAVRKGYQIDDTSQATWIKLGESANGNTIYGGLTGMPYDPRGPMRKKVAQKLGDWHTELRARLRGGDLPFEERLLEEMLDERARVQRFDRDPSAMVLGRITYGNLRAMLGHNLRFGLLNIVGANFNLAMTYGVGTMLRANAVAGRGALRGALRKMADYGERAKLLTTAEAKTMRQAIPLLAVEIASEALGVVPGEIEMTRQNIERLNKGRGEAEDAMLRLASPMFAGTFTEAWNRGLDVAGQLDVARQMELDDRTFTKLYEASNEGRRQAIEDVIGDLNDPNSAASFIVHGQSQTQFYYDMFGQHPFLASGPGKLLGQLTTYPLLFGLHHDIAPAEAFGRTVAAIARGATGRTGAPGQGPAPRDRPWNPADFFDNLAHKGGADWFTRHTARRFVRSFVLVGGLLMIGAWLGINALTFGVPAIFGLGLYALHKLFPDHEDFKKWWGEARFGMVSPVAGALGAGNRGAMGGFGFLWDSGARKGPLELVRRQLTGSTTAIRRLLEEFPEVFDSAGLRWAYQWMDQRTALYDMPLGVKLKHHLGVLPQGDANQYREKVFDRKQIKPGPSPPSFVPGVPKSIRPQFAPAGA